jgi:uncharacterized protein (DUF433 family)
MEFKRITTDATQMGGVPCLRGLRIPVATIVSLVAEGHSADHIIALYPDLEPEDVREALLFAAEQFENEHCRSPRGNEAARR